ncbi:MAG: SO_0444 family Cu/Zn efflux transporter [Candidatus Omnitrophica bacterium]|nr:SO_0444 family Cu/Zn efflux transporter [Candidatus Omnitrophota bacterium]
MIEIVRGLVVETWGLLIEMAPYLLFGFFIAGILHVFMPRDKIYKHFSKASLSSVIKASLFGVPLPLCSCGVIPVAAHLNKEGASKGSTISFLISTPTTGVDSILATYSLLGPLFAIIKPVASFLGGILAGILVNVTDKEKTVSSPPKTFICSTCNITALHSHNLGEKIKSIFRYGFLELIKDTGKWLIIGVVVGGVIGYLVSPDIISKYLGKPQIAYPIMLLVGIPMYVCATGSIPIAASLILKGMSPGAGLIFLFAGPATNTATISFVGGKLGKKVLFIYLFSIVFISVIFGFLIDYIWRISGNNMAIISGNMKMLPYWLKVISAGILTVLIFKGLFAKTDKEIKGIGRIFKVPDMTCQHCVKILEEALKKLDGVKEVRVSLKKKQIEVEGEVAESAIESSIKKTGYSVDKN